MTLKPASFTCPSCGASVLYTNKFCSYCGTQFDDSEPKILNRNERRYKSLYANCYIPRQEMLLMGEDYIYKTVVDKIAKGIVDKLIADKIIKIESNYDILTDSTIYRGYLDVVLPENQIGKEDTYDT